MYRSTAVKTKSDVSVIFSCALLHSALGEKTRSSDKRKKGEGEKLKRKSANAGRSYEERTICIPAVTMASPRARTNISKSGSKCAQRRAQAHGGRRHSARKIIMYVRARGRRKEGQREGTRTKGKRRKKRRRSANMERRETRCGAVRCVASRRRWGGRTEEGYTSRMKEGGRWRQQWPLPRV